MHPSRPANHMPPWELQRGGACLLCCLPGGGTSLLSMAHPHASLQTHIKPPIQDSNHLVTTKMGHRHSVESEQPPTARQGRPLGRVPKPQAGAATLFSWQTCVELNLAAGTVSVGHLWQKCQFWPQLGDLGQMDFSKQLFLLAKAIKTQPGSEKLGDHASVSLWRWVLAHRASSPDAQEGLLLWSPDQGPGPRQLAELLARGCYRDEPFGRKGMTTASWAAKLTSKQEQVALPSRPDGKSSLRPQPGRAGPRHQDVQCVIE